MRKVLIIGPSIDRTKGGMATVIKSQLESNPNKYGFELEHITSHVEGSKIEKLKYFFKSSSYLIRNKDFHLVHIHIASDASFYRKSLLALICKLKKVPTIIHVHGADFDSFYLNSNVFSKFWIKTTFQSCKSILVLSYYWYEFFSKNIINKNVEVLYNGVDIRKWEKSIATVEKLSKFLFLGRLGQRKGIYDLLEAINIIINVKKHKELTFYLAGDGDLEEVESIILKYNLTQNVTLLGWLEDEQKRIYLKDVYTVLLPSYNEGLPMALLEAMAAGKVIISSKVGGIPELVEEGENGFLISPGDVNSLFNYILYVVNNKERMELISLNNMKKIEQKYNLDKLNIRLFNMYSEILSK